VLEAGKHVHHHDDASKKVTAPADVAVVSFMQGFRPGPAVDPIVHRIRAEKSRLWQLKRGEPNLSKAEQGASFTASPPPNRGCLHATVTDTAPASTRSPLSLASNAATGLP
jgi:hypothetical protein